MRRNADEVHNHSAARLSPVNLKRMEHIPPGGSWRDIPFGLLPEGMKRAKRSDHTKRYGRLKWTGLASTILTKCDPHWGAYFHPQQDRSILPSYALSTTMSAGFYFSAEITSAEFSGQNHRDIQGAIGNF